MNKRYAPYNIIYFLSKSNLSIFNVERKDIAINRWIIAVEGAKNAARQIPILKEIEGDKTALCVVDMQKCFLDEGAAIEVPAGRKIIYKINSIAKKLRQKGGIVIFFQFIVDKNIGLLSYFEGQSYLGKDRASPMDVLRPGHPQFELHPNLQVEKADLIINKNRFSAVLGSDIVSILRKKGIENVIVTGVTTDVCAGNTAESLMQADFHVIMVWDGTAALDRLEHELFLAKFFGLYGDVMPTKEILERLK